MLFSDVPQHGPIVKLLHFSLEDFGWLAVLVFMAFATDSHSKIKIATIIT